MSTRYGRQSSSQSLSPENSVASVEVVSGKVASPYFPMDGYMESNMMSSNIRRSPSCVAFPMKPTSPDSSRFSTRSLRASQPLTVAFCPATFTCPAESPVATATLCVWSPLENVFALPAPLLEPVSEAEVAHVPVVTAPEVPVTTGRLAVEPILPSLVMLP